MVWGGPAGGCRRGGVKVDERSDPLHFIPDRQQGLQVVAEGAAESDLMTGLCLVLGFSSG